MTRFDTSTSNRRMPKYRSQRALMADPPEPTFEARQRCAETWARVKREIEETVETTRAACKSKYTPAVPDYSKKDVDLSDFPEPTWSPEQLRDWEARQKANAA